MELSEDLAARMEQLAAHDPVALRADGETIIVRGRVPRAEYKRFRAKSSDKAAAGDALEALTRACVLFPDGAGFDAILERKPALADVFGMRVLELAGLVEGAESKKL